MEGQEGGEAVTRRRAFGQIIRRPRRPGYYVVFTWEGRRITRAVGPLKKTARDKLAVIHGLLTNDIPLAQVLASQFGDVYLHGSRITFREAAGPYVEYTEKRKKKSTLAGDARRIRQILRAAWTGKVLAFIRPADLIPWVQEREKAGVCGPTINRDLSVISALFTWAIRAGYVDDNPVRGVERYSERGRARQIYLTAEEALALIDAACAVLRPILLTALHTGMRKGEILALRWRAVDMKLRQIYIEPETEKAGRGRPVPMTDVLYAEFVRLRSVRPKPALDNSDHVFVFENGRPVRVGPLRTMFVKAKERADLPLEKKQNFRFHDMRHTAASLMVAEGVPLFDVSRILGHSSVRMTERYAHFAPKAGRAAIDALGRALERAGRDRPDGPVDRHGADGPLPGGRSDG